MTTLKLRDSCVVVTGASSGLGLEMARVLAAQHHANLVLVARRADRLQTIKAELEAQNGVQVVTLTADLSDAAACHRMFSDATNGRDIRAVILNAGVTYFGHALEQSPENVLSLVNTNVAGVALLARLFADHLVKRKSDGALMLVSSLGGNMPVPYQAVYGASKAFVTSLGCALSTELGGTGVSVTVFAPGGMRTEMTELSGMASHFSENHPGMMNAALCARLALAAMCRRDMLYVPGALNRLGDLATKLAPRKLVQWAMKRGFQNALKPPP